MDGRQRTAWIGDDPSTGLADARLKVAEFKLALRNGFDPKDMVEKPQYRKRSARSPDTHIWQDIANDYMMLRQRSGTAARTVKN